MRAGQVDVKWARRSSRYLLGLLHLLRQRGGRRWGIARGGCWSFRGRLRRLAVCRRGLRLLRRSRREKIDLEKQNCGYGLYWP